MSILSANWPAPANIVAFTTVRSMGNLAGHAGDDPKTVAANRARLLQEYGLPREPYWLNQTHSDQVVILDTFTPETVQNADGSYTRLTNRVCAVLTADCLPVLLCDTKGQEIAALHAGWRGLLADILARGVSAFGCAPAHILAWLGPAIGPKVFEVGPEVYQGFVEACAQNKAAFLPSLRPEHYFLDIYALTRLYLERLGVKQIYGGQFCTYSDKERFYSYRRENQTGRMATLIWRT